MTKRQLYDDLLTHDVGASLTTARRLLGDAMTHRRVPRGRRRAAGTTATEVLTGRRLAAMGTDGDDIARPGWAALLDRAQVAGLASVGAGAIHLVAAGSHAEHPSVARAFVLLGAVQVVAGLVLALSGRRLAAAAVAAVSAVAVGGWLLTRTTGISWIDGLEASESAQFADTVCAVLGAVGLVLAAVVIARGGRPAPRVGLVVPGVLVALFSVAAMLNTTTHVHAHGTDGEAAPHEHGTDAAADAAHAHEGESEAAAAGGEADHDHGEAAATRRDAARPRHRRPVRLATSVGPDGPDRLLRRARRDGRRSRSGPRRSSPARSPRSAVRRRVDGRAASGSGRSATRPPASSTSSTRRSSATTRSSTRTSRSRSSTRSTVTTETLVSAMFIARDMALDDPELLDYGGPLMQWHVHENLCWKLDADGKPVVAGVTDDDGHMPARHGQRGRRQPDGPRLDRPQRVRPVRRPRGPRRRPDHRRRRAHGPVRPRPRRRRRGRWPFDPTVPVDLSGTPGVTPEQQAFAEDLVDRTLTDLPQWADPEVAEAAGFHSIGDAATGHEHYIQWDWINDDVTLDPNHPESLVYEPQPDGSKQLVSAMYMLPTSVALEDVPDWGGPLMQWHIHDNLCYTDDPEAPKVRGLTRSDGTCPPPLVKHEESAMIHVWITPHECGPFAALEGVGAGADPRGRGTPLRPRPRRLSERRLRRVRPALSRRRRRPGCRAGGGRAWSRGRPRRG